MTQAFWGGKLLGGYAGLKHTAKKIAEFIPPSKLYVEPFCGLASVSKYLNKELIEQSEDLPTVLMKLRVEKLKAEIKYMEIKNNYFEAFNQPMSRRAEIAIKPQIIQQKQVFQNPQSPYDESNRRLQCVDCGSLFCWYSEQEFNSQMQEFQRHLVSKHDRAKTEIERDVLFSLKYEGDSR